MSSPKGYSSQEKEDRLLANFTTVEPIRLLQNGLSVTSHASVTDIAFESASAGSTAKMVISTGTTAKRGDVLLFTSGPNITLEAKVWAVDGSAITLAETLPAAVGTGNTFTVRRHRYSGVNGAGAHLVADASLSVADKLFFDFAATSVTTGAYVQLTSSLAANCSRIDIYNHSTNPMILATGAALAEVDLLYFAEKTLISFPVAINAGTRLSLKSLKGTANTENATFMFYGR